MSARRIGIVGAGTMGRGLCVALTAAGFEVVLVDRSSEVLKRSRALLRDEVRTAALFSGRRLDVQELLARADLTTSLDDLADVEAVLENATERWQVKQPIYEALDRICRADAWFGVNTSAISITRLAALTERPAQVVGMHFMNPAPLKPTVEVIRGHHTSEETLAAARGLVADLDKQSIVVDDSPGFVTNRVMMLMINEAIYLLHEGVASAKEIDRLFVQCFGHAMGPLETADLIGLDTVLLSIEVLYDSFKDSKYRPCPLLTRMVDAGLHGRKTGEGFFNYLGG
ncbi:MAG: 3-hydroxyacyl-CoA dehydrogenase NAD-binding domain-containing protein [Acidobacteriota bacterium]